MERTSRRIFGQNDIEQDWAGPIAAQRLVIRGTVHDDTLVGTSADEVFKPRIGSDVVTGGGGTDSLVIDYSGEPVFPVSLYQYVYADTGGNLYGTLLGGSAQCDFDGITQLKVRLSGGNDNAFVDLATSSRPISVHIDAGSGNDSLILICNQSAAATVEGVDNNSILYDYGTFVNFDNIQVSGTPFDDVIMNVHGFIRGNAGDDLLIGSDSDDKLNSSFGTDTLEGGEGADLFDFSYYFDSSSPRRGIDTILDFSSIEGDRVYFALLDCDKTIRGSQRFVFIGDAEITDAGQLRSVSIGDGVYQVEGNTDADADLEFVLIVHADQPLVAADFGL